MDIVTIVRIYQDDCTVGVLNYKKFRCFTLELPEMGNQANVSCIPEGTYECRKITSPSLGACIDITNVIGRTFVRIHAGNYTSQVLGCVLVGESLKDINNDGIIDVTSSSKTLKSFMDKLPKCFRLVIQ